MTANTGTTGTTGQTDIREFGHELWNYLTGKQAVIEYTFEDMTVEVPKTTGPDAPRATWKMNGTLRVRTSDQDSVGAIGTGTVCKRRLNDGALASGARGKVCISPSLH